MTKDHHGTLAGLFGLTFLYAVVMTIFFTERPDEWRSLATFAQALLQTERPYELEVAWLRVVFLVSNVALCAVLALTGLITKRTLAFAAIWPMTTYLFSKLYWEFFVFPLCLVRYNLTKRQEFGFIAIVLTAFAVTHEGNLLVLLAFRCVLLGQKIGFRRLAPLGFAVFGMAVDQFYDVALQSISVPIVQDELLRFRYVRDVVNPEYSMVETAGIIISSMHFFTMHTDVWIVDTVFSLIVLGYIFTTPEARLSLRAYRHAILAFLCVVVGMTEITHGFQNARYFFFFMPLLANITPVRSYPAVALLGVAHASIKVFI